MQLTKLDMSEHNPSICQDICPVVKNNYGQSPY